MTATIEEGQTRSFTRTFTPEDVRQFAAVSNDEGSHHVEGDDDGTLVLHGLLTATMPTKLGGDIDFLARTMTFEFPRPAYTGEPITCTTTYESVTRHEDRVDLEVSFVCETDDGKVVLRGSSEGIVRQ